MSTVEPRQPDRTLPELLSAMTDDVGTLVRKELELAKEEMRTEVSRAGKAGGVLGAAGFVAYLAVLMLVFAAAWGLDAILPTGLAFLIVGVVLGIVAAVLGAAGKKRLKAVNPKPEQTIQTLKEDAQWLSEQRS